VYVGSSSIAIGGSVQRTVACGCGGGVVHHPYLQGYRDLALFGSLEQPPQFFLFMRPFHSRRSGLRGKRFGSADSARRRFRRRYFPARPSRPRKDVSSQVEPVEMTPALTRRYHRAGVVSAAEFYGQELGFRELAELDSERGEICLERLFGETAVFSSRTQREWSLSSRR